MGIVNQKFSSAVRIARTEGWRGIVRALERNAGVGGFQTGLDECDIVWRFFKGRPSEHLMVDIGAHIGGSLRPFVRNGWQVYAFEPDRANRARLEATFGRFKNLVIDPRAVSNEPKSGVTFYRSDQSTGISSLSAFHDSHQAGELVDITTLSDVIRKAGITGIDFLKIDTEGHDLFVLQGLPWDIVKPRVVLCEFENNKTEPLGYRYEQLAGYLIDRGYRLITSEWYPIQRYGISHRWRRFAEGQPPALVDHTGWGNILGVRDAADWAGVRAACDAAAAKERAAGA